MNLQPIIQNVDGTRVSDDDRFDIDANVCINCFKHYNDLSRIMYVRTSQGNFLWWHTEHCSLTNHH